MTISQRVQDVRGRRPQSKIGQRATSSLLDYLGTLINSAPQAYEVRTFTITGATNAKEYTVTINGIDVSYTSDASATVAEIADGLAAAIDVEPLVRGQISAASDAVDTVTLTALQPGIAFTLTEADAQITTASVTSAASADSIPFGRLLISTGYQSDAAATETDGEANELGALPLTGNFAAQVDTWTTTYVASVTYYVSITIDGVTYMATALADTNTSDTVDAIAAAVNAVMPANTVIAAGATTFVSFTAEVPGAEFALGAGVGDEGATFPAVTLTSTKGLATSLAIAAAGVSLYATDEENTTIEGDDPVYPANAGVRILRSGLVVVESAEAPTKGDDVYVETAAGADLGKMFVASSATRVLLPGAKWERDARPSSGDDLGWVRLSL